MPRTLVDISSVLSLDALARACHEAGVRYGATPRAVEAVLAQRPGSPGARKLRRVIHGDVHVTLSTLEAHFLELLRSENLPLPITNKPAGSHRVDCRWPEHRLTHHDRQREREARARGDDFRRYTYGDVFEHPALMLRELRYLSPASSSASIAKR